MLSNDLIAEIPLSNTSAIPKEGPRAVLVNLDFSAQTSYSFDLLSLTNRRAISNIQCLYVDNVLNGSTLTISVNSSQQTITVQANQQGYYPVLVPQTFGFTFSSAGGVKVKVHLLNFPAPSGRWGPSSITLPNPLPVSDTILDGCVSAGKLAVHIADASVPIAGVVTETTLDACVVAGNKIAVQDATAETSLATLAGTVTGAKVGVVDTAAESSLATLAGGVSGAKYQVTEATLDGCITANKLAVTDASAETSLSTLAGAITASPSKIQMGIVGNGGSNYPKWMGNTVVNTAVTATSTTLFTAAAGYYVTSIFCSFDPLSTLATAGTVAVQFQDSVAGTFWSFYIWIPHTVPTYTTPQIFVFKTPAGFRWNNKNSGSALKILLGVALTAGGMAFTVNYGFTTIVG